MTENTKRLEKSPQALAAMHRQQQQRSTLARVVKRCGSAITPTEEESPEVWKMVSCGDTILYKGKPFGDAHHWTDLGVSVRIFAAHKIVECDPANDTLVGLTVTHVELTPVHFLSGLFTVKK